MKQNTGDHIIEIMIIAILIIVCFTMLYPFWNSIVISFNEGSDTAKGGISFFIRKFTLENYRLVFRDKRFLNAFGVTVARTVAGTAITTLISSMFAFSLTKKALKLRKIYLTLAVITMYFGGGMIPTYILIRDIGLRDNFFVYVFPGAVNVWNMIIFRTFFNGLPSSLEESARLDGANYYRIYFSLIIPLSMPVFATLALFTAVAQWNSWFDAAIYIRSQNLMPVQNLLRTIINANSMAEMMSRIGGTASEQMMLRRSPITTRSLTMATMVVATLPVMLVYPFIQKHFVQGIMIGSLKE